MAVNLKGDGNVYNPMSVSIPRGLPLEEIAELQSQAIEFASDSRFHRSFILPPNPSIGRHESIRVSYADGGLSPVDASDGEEIPVLLWCGGMFGGRYQAIIDDEEARSHRVRFIAVDKPGVGGTGSVPLEQRIGTWLDIVPALLQHLGIKHVSLTAHSNGTIYVLNILLHRRELLHPKRPFVALFAPWVLPKDSSKHQLSVLQCLPSSVLGSWHRIAGFVHGTIAPLVNNNNSCPLSPPPTSSFNPIIHLSRLLPSSASKSSPNPLPQPSHSSPSSPSPSSPSSSLPESNISLRNLTSRTLLHSLLTTYIFHESLTGASQEVLFCVQKSSTPATKLWGFKDYPALAAQVVSNESHRQPTNSKLRVLAIFASADDLVGAKGQEFFERCWRDNMRSESSSKIDGHDVGVKDVLDFESVVIKNTDHNSVLAIENGGIRRVLEEVSCTWRGK